jgi:kinesin family member 1
MFSRIKAADVLEDTVYTVEVGQKGTPNCIDFLRKGSKLKIRSFAHSL